MTPSAVVLGMSGGAGRVNPLWGAVIIGLTLSILAGQAACVKQNTQLNMTESSVSSHHYFLTTDGVKLHYTIKGRGQTIVFVPGWTMPSSIFSGQMEFFSKHAEVVLFDPRSQGESQIALSGHTAVRRGKDIHELITHLGAKKIVIVAWSLGVLDTLAYIGQFGSAKISALVLIDNSIGLNSAFPIEPHPIMTTRKSPIRPKTQSAYDRRRAFVESMFFKPKERRYIEQLTAASLRTPPNAASSLRNYKEPRRYWRNVVLGLDVPILYIVRQRLIGQAIMLKRSRKKAQFVVMNDAGHALFVDQCDRFNNVLNQFLDTQGLQ